MAEEKGKTLVELDSEFRGVIARIESLEGDPSPEAEVQLREVMQALCEKVDGYAAIISEFEAQRDKWKEREEHCGKARKYYTASIERLKDTMRFVLGNNPTKSLQGEYFRFFLSKAAPRLEINESELPDAFKTVKITTVPDRDAIETALLKGEKVPGCQLVENYSLRQGRPK